LSEQTTTKTPLPTVLLLLPSFQAYNFNILFNTIYNLDDYTLAILLHLQLLIYNAQLTVKNPNCNLVHNIPKTQTAVTTTDAY
jgi:hypothetical protein